MLILNPFFVFLKGHQNSALIAVIKTKLTVKSTSIISYNSLYDVTASSNKMPSGENYGSYDSMCFVDNDAADGI